jgi:16S rRNA (guanine(966)-N(2))-methyltransferase RsmD
MDRLREAMFSILKSALGSLEGVSFLDLFSGSGIVGIEAASRGAAPVVLVERDRGKYRTLSANIDFVVTPIRVVIASAESFLRSQRPSGGAFGLVFLDPPFAYRRKADLLDRVCASGALSSEGLVLLHHPRQEEMPGAVGGLRRQDRRSFGGSVLSIYGHESD